MQRSGEQLRVTARLLSVDDGRQLWSGRFDEQCADIFAVQDSIADRVTAALALQLWSAATTRGSPNSMPPVVTYARGLYSARRHGEAAAALERVVEVEPENMLARALLASTCIELGRFDEALALASDVAGRAPGGFSVAAVALVRAGRTDQARAELNRLVEMVQHRYVPAYDIASVHAALRDADQAFQWLDRAFAEPSALLGTLRADPVMDPLRGDPRYSEVEPRRRLPER